MGKSESEARMRNGTYWLIAILIAAAALRLFGLGRGDPMNDEVTYAFRAIGLVDSFNDPSVQSTPWEWFDPEIPRWAKISFHDHPPLVIWIQHLFFKLFGERLWAFRLPSAILGIASVGLMFAIGRRLFSERAGLIGAAFLAATVNHVYVSRAGLQEPYVIFFMLLAVLLLLRGLARPRWVIASGAALGFGLLAKYTAIAAVPVLLGAILLLKPAEFRTRHFWLGVLAALVIVSPVIIYNVLLWRTAGHFDLQLSHILGKTPAVWAGSPGKAVGSLADRARIFLPRLIASNSWVFLGLAALSAAAFLAALIRRPLQSIRRFAIPALGALSIFGLIAATGPAFRFLTLLTPFLALGIGAMLAGVIKPATDPAENSYSHVLKNMRIRNGALAAALAPVVIFEAFYAANSQIAYYPLGPRPWLSSAIRYENFNWGYNELEAYLTRELRHTYPAATFETKYRFVRELQDASIGRAKASGAEPYPALIAYYGNFDLAPQLWIFDRRLMYHGWPVIPWLEYRKAAAASGENAFARAGIQHEYFILQTNIVPEPEFAALVRDIEPIPIANPRGEEAFRVYKR